MKSPDKAYLVTVKVLARSDGYLNNLHTYQRQGCYLDTSSLFLIPLFSSPLAIQFLEEPQIGHSVIGKKSSDLNSA